MDFNKTHGETARWELHKNSACYFELILEVTRPKQQLHGKLTPISKTNQVKRTTHVRPRWRSKDELKSDVFLGSPSHGRASVGRLARTYLHQLCTDTRYSLEDLSGAMDDRDGWIEIEKSMPSTRLDDDDMYNPDSIC